ncbi:hypothetical protein ACFVP0_27125 [Streptomyces cinereoruber]|uniref:hypothetical protein n=1 Tax=Streptomyces cinereoruber TaxID=67260 RepID=UPI0036AAE034
MEQIDKNPALSGPDTPRPAGPVRARRAIATARTRGTTPSDGGGTGRSDSND